VPGSQTVAPSPYIEFETETPGQKGVIFAGIATPEWHINDDGHNYSETHTVNLGYQCLSVIQYTVSVGLASIYNGGSAFLFATDAATLCIDSETQELNLQVDLTLLGSPSNLSRYGYQVSVIVTTQQTGISGTISYPVGAFGPANPTVQELNQLLGITANNYVSVSNQGFGSGYYNPVAYGVVTGVASQGQTVVATYNIAAAPYNLDLSVLVKSVDTMPLDSGFSQDNGPSTLTLTIAAPTVSNVDFSYFLSPIK
jgi:hypothetical protein